jgi:uracil-DNA glycosylase
VPTSTQTLLADIRACRICEPHLPLGPRPVLQLHPQARILVASQAPGRRVHATGVPFDDASGDRLRDWLGLTRTQFHDPKLVAIVPMGMCYPGTGRAGDLPPRPECASTWRAPLLALLRHIELTLVIGRHAIDWHFGGAATAATSLTERVADWRMRWPALLPLPHPSPRNNRWLKVNPWFERDVLPALRERVARIVGLKSPPLSPSPRLRGEALTPTLWLRHHVAYAT